MGVEFGVSRPYPVSCRGIDGMQRTFFAFVARTRVAPTHVVVRAYVGTDPGWDEFFEVGADEVGGSRLQIVAMDHHQDARFEKMGLPEACIRLLGQLIEQSVVSSSNRRAVDSGEWRTPAATKAWDRLVAAGHARYDPDEDRFVLSRC